MTIQDALVRLVLIPGVLTLALILAVHYVRKDWRDWVDDLRPIRPIPPTDVTLKLFTTPTPAEPAEDGRDYSRIEFKTELFDTEGMHWAVTRWPTITGPSTGMWHIAWTPARPLETAQAARVEAHRDGA